jgi:hypothetical protein
MRDFLPIHVLRVLPVRRWEVPAASSVVSVEVIVFAEVVAVIVDVTYSPFCIIFSQRKQLFFELSTKARESLITERYPEQG